MVTQKYCKWQNNTNNKLVKPIHNKCFQSQGHMKQNLTKHAHCMLSCRDNSTLIFFLCQATHTDTHTDIHGLSSTLKSATTKTTKQKQKTHLTFFLLHPQGLAAQAMDSMFWPSHLIRGSSVRQTRDRNTSPPDPQETEQWPQPDQSSQAAKPAPK